MTFSRVAKSFYLNYTKKVLLFNYVIALFMGFVFIVFNPHPYGPWGFDSYSTLGWNLVQGNGYSLSGTAPFDKTAFRLPAYPVLLSLFYRFFGHNYLPVLVFQAFLNAFICILIYYLIKDILERKLALFISFLVAVLGFSNIYVSSTSTDMITTFLIVLAAFILYCAYKQNKPRLYFIHGFILSLAILMRPAMLIFPLFYFLAFICILKKFKIAIKYLILCLFGISFLFIPWVWRNYSLTKNIIITGTQGGSQLFYGAMESGPYFSCRVYNPFHHYENLDTYRSLSKSNLTFSVSIDAAKAKEINSIELYYTAADSKQYQRLDMKYVGGGIFECKAPRLVNSAIIKYYFRIKYQKPYCHYKKYRERNYGYEALPIGAPGINYLFYNSRLGSDGFDREDNRVEVLDVFDFVKLVRLITDHPYQHNNVLINDIYDYDGNHKINKKDLSIMADILLSGGITGNRQYIKNIKLNKDNSELSVDFSDNSRMTIPSEINDSKLFIKAQSGLAFGILNKKYFVDYKIGKTQTSHLPNTIIKSGVDYRGVIGEINKQSLYLKLYKFYIKNHPKDYFLAVLKKMLRMWITVGSSDRTISYSAPGGRNVLFVLAKYFSLCMFILCCIGILLLRKRIKDIVFVLIPIIYFPLTNSFFMVNARHTLPANPFIFIFVGVVLFYILNKTRGILRLTNK